jgi:hypothetical protein
MLGNFLVFDVFLSGLIIVIIGDDFDLLLDLLVFLDEFPGLVTISINRDGITNSL